MAMTLRTSRTFFAASFLLASISAAACGDDTGTGGTGGGPPPPEPCESAAECPKGPCENATCEAGVCGTTPKEDGIEVEIQSSGDCKVEVCDGQGNTRFEIDDTDVRTFDLDECEAGACTDGVAEVVASPLNTPCGDNEMGFCNANADCVECTMDSQCMSMICNVGEGSCAPATCGNMMVDGDETDEDCGGSCPSCGTGLNCNGGDDCLSLVCEGGTCQAPTCTDQEQNGSETDEDCGGPDCGPCGLGDNCLVGEDCTSTICKQGECSQINECDPNAAMDLTGQAQVTIVFGGGDGNLYSPRCIKVDVGTELVFNGNFDLHPLVGGEVFNGQKEPAVAGPFIPTTSTGTTSTKVMSSAGGFGYYCEVHALGGMTGAVFVE
jgi:plastocyanin